MTERWFLSVREAAASSSVLSAFAFRGEWDRIGPADRVLETLLGRGRWAPLDQDLAKRAAGAHVLIATHGFNVGAMDAMRRLAVLTDILGFGERVLVVGLLWPGDAAIPVVNYPGEAETARQAGSRLATYCQQRLGGAASISMLSHSLGGRVVLEAAKRLNGQRRIKLLCLTAAAVDNDCLTTVQYRDAYENCDSVRVFASRADAVLRLAYPAGDLISDLLLGDRDSPFRGALGRSGARSRPGGGSYEQVVKRGTGPFGMTGIGHGDYFPRGAPATGDAAVTTAYMREAVAAILPR